MRLMVGEHDAWPTGAASDTWRPDGANLRWRKLQRHSLTLVLISVSLLVIGVLLPQPARRCWATLMVVLWAAAGLLSAVTTVRLVAARVSVNWAKVRMSVSWAGAKTKEAQQFIRSLPERLTREPFAWPFLMASGLVAAFSAFGVLSVSTGTDVIIWTLFATGVAYVLVRFVHAVRDMNRYVSMSSLLFSVLLYIGLGVLMSYSFGWPKPNADFFAVTAQINAALLVAAAFTTAAPTAWRKTPQIYFAWIATGPVIATVGLGASIAGAISDEHGTTLFPVSVSPVVPIGMALLVGAYRRLRAEAETEG